MIDLTWEQLLDEDRSNLLELYELVFDDKSKRLDIRSGEIIRSPIEGNHSISVHFAKYEISFIAWHPPGDKGFIGFYVHGRCHLSLVIRPEPKVALEIHDLFLKKAVPAEVVCRERGDKRVVSVHFRRMPYEIYDVHLNRALLGVYDLIPLLDDYSLSRETINLNYSLVHPMAQSFGTMLPLDKLYAISNHLCENISIEVYPYDVNLYF